MEQYFADQKLHPADLKAAVEKYINKLLEPIRKTFESPELQKLSAAAYPPPAKTKGANAPNAAAPEEEGPHRLDIRVGKVVEVQRHPDADTFADHTVVEPIIVPSSAAPGSRLAFEGYSGQPDEQLNPKKKVWEKLSADFKTNSDGFAVWNDNFPRRRKTF
ncbi:hypothetical protein DOY81_011178 [Sarcophaga bullata]|nr:hypothetical protein DOY81_011178 [Sarcophaga bullata]